MNNTLDIERSAGGGAAGDTVGLLARQHDERLRLVDQAHQFR